MSGFGESSGGGPKYTGFALVGPPFAVVKEFRSLEDDWAGGRWSAVVSGTIIKPMAEPVVDFTGEKHFLPEDSVGEQVVLYLQHPLKNHVPDPEDADGYKYLASRWDKFGRPWPEFWTEMVLSKAGARTQHLSVGDDEKLLSEIVALLNTGGSWPLAVWDSRASGIEMERQIPPGTDVLCRFHKFLYWDILRKRPTWVKYEYEYQGKMRTFRDVTFLLRVVAPKLWAGTLLRLSANYTIVRGVDEEGKDQWQKPAMAVFDEVMTLFGVSPADFLPAVPIELLTEVAEGEIANLLGPLEAEMQKMAEIGRLVHISIDDKWSVKRAKVQVADNLVIQRIGGDGFKPTPLRDITSLTKEQIESSLPVEKPPVSPLKLEDSSLPPADVASEFNTLAARFNGPWIYDSQLDLQSAGIDWLVKYMIPVYEVLGLNRKAPLDGWTAEMMTKAIIIVGDSLYREMCEKGVPLEDGLLEYAQNLLVGEEESAAASEGNGF